MYSLDLLLEAKTLEDIDDSKLIRRFTINEKSKARDVNDPIPELKAILRVWNDTITGYYMNKLDELGVNDIAHAYLPNKSIQTNARIHLNSTIIQFDFKGFYDSCKFNYFKHHLKELDPDVNDTNESIISRLLIDPNTGGVTQGLPVSGALAGLTLIPFWVELKNRLPENIKFTQYSDDLTFSHTGFRPDEFTIPKLSQIIYEVLGDLNLEFKLNDKKTRMESGAFRKITGIRINHHNQMTPSRKDYRFLRHALYVLSKSNDLDRELAIWGFKSKASFTGKISYMRSIDDTGKINNIIMEYRSTCYNHDLFKTWIKDSYRNSAFA